MVLFSCLYCRKLLFLYPASPVENIVFLYPASSAENNVFFLSLLQKKCILFLPLLRKHGPLILA
jgi:hypothetical protein